MTAILCTDDPRNPHILDFIEAIQRKKKMDFTSVYFDDDSILELKPIKIEYLCNRVGGDNWHKRFDYHTEQQGFIFFRCKEDKKIYKTSFDIRGDQYEVTPQYWDYKFYIVE